MKNQYTVTKDLMKNWAKEFILTDAANTIVFIMLIFIGLCGLFIIALNMIFGIDDWLNLFFGIFFLLFSIYRLFIFRFVFFAQRYKQYSKIYGKEEWQRTTEFLEDEIVFTEDTSTVKLQYKNIKKIKEYDDKVFILFEGKAVLRLYKNAFFDCAWEDVKTLIESKK